MDKQPLTVTVDRGSFERLRWLAKLIVEERHRNPYFSLGPRINTAISKVQAGDLRPIDGSKQR